jgi:hypothetical protein
MAISDRARSYILGRMIIVLGLTAAIPAGRSKAAETAWKLSAGEIRAHVIGREMTDDVHWSEIFQRNGTIISNEAGLEHQGRWKIIKDQLCVWIRDLDGACYDIWMDGNEVQLRTEDSENYFTAHIRTARE